MLWKLPNQTKAFIIAEMAMAGLCVYRVYDYWTTGFFVSDEYGYFYYATHGLVYGGRWFFGGLNILLFGIPGLASVDGFAFILPFYLFLWSGLTLFFFYRTLVLLGLDEKTTVLSLLSSFALVSFVLLSLGFLTEPVGLALAMGGVYFLFRFFRSNTDKGRLVFPLFAATFFGAAGGTREPYNAFLIAGVVLVALTAYEHRDRMEGSRYGRKTLTILSIALFVLPAGLLYNANSYTTAQVPSLGQQIERTILTNPANVIPSVTTTETKTGTMTETMTITYTQSGIVRTNFTIVLITTTTTIVSTPALNYPFYAKSLILNTLAIFIGGILLGWGPLAFFIGLVGILIVLRATIRTREMQHLLILLTSLAAFGSYLVVSFIFAPDPSYLSFQNYSTIIRFSDTALPAFFLTAPFALSVVSRNRKRIVMFLAILAAFFLIGVPAYQVYSTSNLATGGAGNPLSLAYRTPAAVVRDYIAAHQNAGPFYIAGLPYDWLFTPGVQGLKAVSVYTLTRNAEVPFLNYTTFVTLHWNSFYVYSSTPKSPATALPTFLADLFQNPANQTYPYRLTDSQVVTQNPDFALLHVSVSWR